MLLGLSVFSVFFSHVLGFAGAGGLCTLVLSFLAALVWKTDKVTGRRSGWACGERLGGSVQMCCKVYQSLKRVVNCV